MWINNLILPTTVQRESTRAGAGYRNPGDCAPFQVYSTSQITDAIMTVVSLCTQSNNPLTYPYFAWAGIYRINYSDRELLGMLLFQITTPTTPGNNVGIQNDINTQLLASNTALSPDGRYIAFQVLQKIAPATLAVQPIPIQIGWLIGMELLGPQSANGGAGTVISVQELNGSTNYFWTGGAPPAQPAIPFAQTISGYANPIISLTTA